jgi:membrane protein implicated in regulation of membrane protease activity
MPLFEWPALGWLALAVVSAIVEVSIPHFGLVFVAMGAVAAAAAAALTLPLPIQIVVFCVVLTVSVFALRRRLVAGLNSRGVPSRTEQLIGKDGIVTHDIDPTAGGGRVNVGGEDWAALSSEGIAAGTRVRVVGADGIVLEVRRS